ncbi:MAG: hypothetical protein KJ634_12125 [Gammaproteobacteria bacterium]|nr:hypothetical protein [Gammaproteobacteria bacterium]MBU1416362.1 hypothetical protein [Gammaproteobacteria bacterium]
MSTISEYFQQAELSLAAYAQLSSGMSPVALAVAVQQDGKGLSPKQAEEFAKTWRVVDQYTPTETVTTTDEYGNETQITVSNGLSVTLFKNVETHERYVAVRGTEVDDAGDLWTDFVDIALLGTPERQAQYAALKARLDEWLTEPDRLQGQTFTVTGHSLGGFLAGALLVDFPPECGVPPRLTFAADGAKARSVAGFRLAGAGGRRGGAGTPCGRLDPRA